MSRTSSSSPAPNRVHRIVVDLNDRRPIWAIPPWAVEELRAALPDGWHLDVATTPADGSGDGGGGPHPQVLKAVRGARVYIGYGVPAGILEAGRESLEWVHTGTAGVGSSLHPAMRSSGVRFTNSAGTHAPPIAETVVGMLLHFYRGLDFAVDAQARGVWRPEPFLHADTPVRELAHDTVGILGYGGIGREVGRRVRSLGAQALGLKRRPPPVEGATAEGRRSPATDEHGVVLLHGDEGLDRLLAESDALVVCVPDTPATRGILSRERIRALRPGAVVVNVARGRIVDETALTEALEDGHLRGAGLDVFATEPLPADSPLWELPNVLLTPHVSGVSRGFWRREMDLIVENLNRFLAGMPMVNEVDLDAGY
jgi:phosphoglycerate dehydrogenase-like enzyme